MDDALFEASTQRRSGGQSVVKRCCTGVVATLYDTLASVLFPAPRCFVPRSMDRHAFLDALPYLRPCSREPVGAPVWSGCASFSLSLEEQFSGAAVQDAPHSPLGASAQDASWLFFAVSERTSEDATQLRADLHVDASGDVVFVLDGRAYAVNGPCIKHVSARVPESGTLPPFVTLLFARVTLTLVPAHGRAWAVEAPLLLAAANALVRALSQLLAARSTDRALHAGACARCDALSSADGCRRRGSACCGRGVCAAALARGCGHACCCGDCPACSRERDAVRSSY